MRIPKNIPPINPCVNLKITLLTFGGMVDTKDLKSFTQLVRLKDILLKY